MFPLHPEVPTAGVTLEEYFAGRRYDVDAARARLRKLADQEGLPFGETTHVYNSLLAQELAKWAEQQPTGGGIHDALFRAVFVDNRNIGDSEVLLSIAAGLGLDAAEARRALDERTMKGAVDVDWRRAVDLGVTGVPTFVLNDMATVGAQPYQLLERFMEAAGATRRAA